MTYTSNPIANDELTEMIKNDRYVRTLANIARRAENLWDDGYTAKLTTESAHHQSFLVYTPADEFYSVTLTDTPICEAFGDSCSCPAFAKYSTCKHLMAIQWQVREQAQADAFDAMMANAEGPFGTDPNYRY